MFYIVLLEFLIKTFYMFDDKNQLCTIHSRCETLRNVWLREGRTDENVLIRSIYFYRKVVGF